jgi:hypothetical protein
LQDAINHPAGYQPVQAEDDPVAGNIGKKKDQALLFKIEDYLRKYSLWAFSIVMILLIFMMFSL